MSASDPKRTSVERDRRSRGHPLPRDCDNVVAAKSGRLQRVLAGTTLKTVNHDEYAGTTLKTVNHDEYSA
jgi:hypothetical protein